MAVMFIALFAGRISASAAVSGQVTASTLFVRTGPSTEYPKVTVNGKVARASYDVNVGDIIEADGFRGTVKEIGIRTVSIEDVGGNIKIINNSNLKNIINRSNNISIVVCEMQVAYKTDLEKLDKVLKKCEAFEPKKYKSNTENMVKLIENYIDSFNNK